jgi:hypothetical protein
LTQELKAINLLNVGPISITADLVPTSHQISILQMFTGDG